MDYLGKSSSEEPTFHNPFLKPLTVAETNPILARVEQFLLPPLVQITTGVKDFEITLPIELIELRAQILKSEYILNLKPDYDDQGSIPPTHETWKKAITFVVDYSKSIYENNNLVISPPVISAGPNSSIDVRWSNLSYSVLVNIPEGANSLATYFGDDSKGGNIAEGNLNKGVQQFFASWLTNLKK